jgi:hypothetical protein
MAKLTVNNIFEALEAVKKDISDVDTNQRLRIANMLNQEIYELNKSIKPDDTVGVYDFATTPGTSRYSLPTDFEDMKALGCGLFELTDTGEINNELQLSYAGANEGYYLGGEIVALVYTPSLYLVQTPTSSQQYRLRYNKTLTELTSLADETILDKRFLQLARDFVLKEYAIFDEDPSKEQVADQRYALSKAEYIRNARQTPGVYAI